MKLAIVHDFLNQFGGAERVVLALHELYPEAPIFTSISNPARLPADFQRLDIRVSFMQRLPFIFPLYKPYFFLYPLAFEQFDLSGFDLILSSCSAFAKGVKKKASQLHLCYCYTPMRFAWRYDDYIRRENIPGFLKSLLPFFLEPLRRWDLANSQNVDYFIAISQTVAERIKKIYGRESAIIYPPVEVELFRPGTIDRDYYLVVSRLNAYKRIDLVVEAFNRLALPLKIIGQGPDQARLQKLAGPSIEFLGRLTDQEIADHLAACRALIFPGEEDFGIVPLEAMACGRPVIAYRAGGAAETVSEGQTGLFFNQPTVPDLMAAVKRFNFEVFDKQAIRSHALKFSKDVFKQKLSSFIKEKYEEKFCQ